MKSLKNIIIDNEAGLVPSEFEGTMEYVFRTNIAKAKNMDSDEQYFRLDIGSGYVFLSGLRIIVSSLRDLYERGILQLLKDPSWGQQSPIRIVMGAETGRETRSKLMNLIHNELGNYEDEALRDLAYLLEEDIIEFKVFTERRFHAKVFNFYHASDVPKETWVGSANLSAGGLRQNIELCAPVSFENEEMRNLYRTWFDSLWERAEEKIDLLSAVDEVLSSKYIYNPPKIFFSKLIPLLQKEYLFDTLPQFSYDRLLLDFQILSYSIVMDSLNKYGGFILANSVGLGKSYVAAQAMLSMLHQNPGKKCLLIYPPRIQTEWEDYLRKFGISDRVTMLSRGMLQKSPYDSGEEDAFSIKGYEDEYSFIVVDEAHRFRRRSYRRYNLDGIVLRNHGAKVLLVTATPVNLGLNDLFSLIDIFYQGDRHSRFATYNLKALYDSTHNKVSRKDDTDLSLNTIKDIRVIEKELVLKISWRIVQEHFKEDLNKLSESVGEYEEPKPHEIDYDYPSEIEERIFDRVVPFLESLNYEPAKLWDGEDYKNDKNLTFWYKWQLYKRLESSLYAFYKSLVNLSIRFSVYYETIRTGNLLTPDVVEDSNIGVSQDEFEDLIDQERHRVILQTYRKQEKRIKQQIRNNLKNDVDTTNMLLEDVTDILLSDSSYPFEGDTKVKVLLDVLQKHKKPAIVFSQFADTIDYLQHSLADTDFRIESIHGQMSKDKDALLQRYEAGDFDIILTTDVLSEGVSIPRADVVINFDLPYNPVLLVQRTGRALRITRPKTVDVLNFVPEPDIDKELDLYDKLDVRLRTILDIVGFDFVIWMVEEKKVSGVYERERKEFLNIYSDYKKRIANTNPDNLVMRGALPAESRTDRILKHAIDHYGISREQIVEFKSNRRPFYTTLVGDGSVALVTREGNENVFVSGLKDVYQPSPQIEIPDWFETEKKTMIEELKIQLARERASRRSLNQRERKLIGKLSNTFYSMQENENRRTIVKVRNCVESGVLSKSDMEIVDHAVTVFLDSANLLVNPEEVVTEKEEWMQMEKIVERFDIPGEREIVTDAFILYQNGE